MSKSKIEWLRDPITGKQGYTINPVKGMCPVACPYCYARRMYTRFKRNPEIDMPPDWGEDLPKQPTKVFVGSTMELFGDWVDEWMWKEIWTYINGYPQHTFIFLTKRPENLIKWSPFPENVWVGVSAENATMAEHAGFYLYGLQASVRFVSFEPLLGEIPAHFQDYLGDNGINWLIIGQQTPVTSATSPKMEWIRSLTDAALKCGVPVFLKNNLSIGADVAMQVLNLRQEFPMNKLEIS